MEAKESKAIGEGTVDTHHALNFLLGVFLYLPAGCATAWFTGKAMTFNATLLLLVAAPVVVSSFMLRPSATDEGQMTRTTMAVIKHLRVLTLCFAFGAAMGLIAIAANAA